MRTFIYRDKLPKIKAVDLSQRLYPRQKLAYDDKHRITIVDDGVEDVQASIEAASCVSLAELCASMPGRSPLEKLDSALKSGLLGSVPEGDSEAINDFTQVPQSIEDIYSVGTAARKIVGQKGDLSKLINEYVKKALAEQAAAANASKGDVEK